MKKFFCCVIGCMSILILFSVVFAMFLGQNIVRDKVVYLNNKAKNYYCILVNEQIQLVEYIENLSTDQKIIFGESNDLDSIVMYLNKRKILIYGDEQLQPNSYWAIRIENGNIVNVWSSNYPLKEEQLITYSTNEQRKKMGIFEKLNKTDVIGYYNAKEDNPQ